MGTSTYKVIVDKNATISHIRDEELQHTRHLSNNDVMILIGLIEKIKIPFTETHNKNEMYGVDDGSLLVLEINSKEYTINFSYYDDGSKSHKNSYKSITKLTNFILGLTLEKPRYS